MTETVVYLSLLTPMDAADKKANQIIEVPLSKTREPRAGPMVNHPLAKELRKIHDHIHLSGHEFVQELKNFDGIPLTRELYQSYLQGYVQNSGAYEKLLKRIRPFRDSRYEQYKHLMDADARTIISGWLEQMNVDHGGSQGSPFRLFVKLLGPQINPLKPNDPPKLKDQSTLFRWYRDNKKPHSINELIWYGEVVNRAAIRRK